MESLRATVRMDPDPPQPRTVLIVEWFRHYMTEYAAYAGMFATAYVILLLVLTILMQVQRLTSLTILPSFAHVSLYACMATPIVMLTIMVSFGYEDWKLHRTFPRYLREKVTEGVIGFVICCGIGYALILAGTTL